MKNLLSILVLFLLVSCQNSSSPSGQAIVSEAGYSNVTNEEFKKLTTKSNTIILDVRTPKETSRGVIPGAIKLDYKDKGFASGLDELDKSKAYLVYCHAGGRSANACKMMKEKGFSKLYNLDGGYVGWD
jgi:phage shock protein E